MQDPQVPEQIAYVCWMLWKCLQVCSKTTWPVPWVEGVDLLLRLGVGALHLSQIRVHSLSVISVPVPVMSKSH